MQNPGYLELRTSGYLLLNAYVERLCIEISDEVRRMEAMEPHASHEYDLDTGGGKYLMPRTRTMDTENGKRELCP